MAAAEIICFRYRAGKKGIQCGSRERVGLKIARCRRARRIGRGKFGGNFIFGMSMALIASLGASAGHAQVLAAPPSTVGPLQAVQPVTPAIFATVALHIPPNPTSTRWAKLMGASLAQSRLEQLAAEARGLSPQEQVAYVQMAVSSQVRENSLTASCSDDGYWAPAQETLARGLGDCFDVLIAKMEALRALGVPAKDLYLTTGRLRMGLAGASVHETAALLVRIDERFWLLPDWTSRPIEIASGEDDPSSLFTPVITYGVGRSWVHGRLLHIASAGGVSGTRVAR